VDPALAKEKREETAEERRDGQDKSKGPRLGDGGTWNFFLPLTGMGGGGVMGELRQVPPKNADRVCTLYLKFYRGLATARETADSGRGGKKSRGGKREKKEGVQEN